jgi:histone-lysine N-methyltransferase SETMAR
MEGVEILPHPGYSPVVASSDCGLFRAIQHFLRRKKIENVEEVEIACRNFFVSKNKDCYCDQIRKLSNRWSKVIEFDDLYVKE